MAVGCDVDGAARPDAAAGPEAFETWGLEFPKRRPATLALVASAPDAGALAHEWGHVLHYALDRSTSQHLAGPRGPRGRRGEFWEFRNAASERRVYFARPGRASPCTLTTVVSAYVDHGRLRGTSASRPRASAATASPRNIRVRLRGISTSRPRASAATRLRGLSAPATAIARPRRRDGRGRAAVDGFRGAAVGRPRRLSDGAAPAPRGDARPRRGAEPADRRV